MQSDESELSNAELAARLTSLATMLRIQKAARAPHLCLAAAARLVGQPVGSAIPAKCRDCPHIDFDATDDDENMWSFCKHPSVDPVIPEVGCRLSLDTQYGDNVPPQRCPIRHIGSDWVKKTCR
jgi:hypothetical protein